MAAMNEPNPHVTIDTKQMQSELDRRQQELEYKARELAEREEALRQAGGEFQRQHNWPPLPSFCPVKPCFFQDISVDIKPEFQGVVELGYRIWVGFIITLLVNLIGSLALMLGPGTPLIVGSAVFSLILFVPLSYVAWFRPLYKAFRNDSSFNFMVFFFAFFLQTFMAGAASLGLLDMCGLWVFLGVIGQNFIVILIVFIVTCVWAAYVAGSVLYLMKVHNIYRSSGATMAKARTEFAQGIISNSYVQQTVANAARETVNQTLNTQRTDP